MTLADDLTPKAPEFRWDPQAREGALEPAAPAPRARGRRPHPARGLVPARFVLHQLAHRGRSAQLIAFAMVLPPILYLMFGATTAWAGDPTGRGNAAAFTMVTMATFGASMCMTSVAALTTEERESGWQAQLGLAGLRTEGYLAAKFVVAMVLAIVAVGLVLLTGVLTGAELATPTTWAASAALAVLASVPLIVLGLAVGQWVRGAAAALAAGGTLIFLYFLGNGFLPLNGPLLELARFTPLYGTISLARWPQMEGLVLDGTGGLRPDSLGWVLGSVVVWTAVFVVLELWGRRRRAAR